MNQVTCFIPALAVLMFGLVRPEPCAAVTAPKPPMTDAELAYRIEQLPPALRTPLQAAVPRMTPAQILELKQEMVFHRVSNTVMGGAFLTGIVSTFGGVTLLTLAKASYPTLMRFGMGYGLVGGITLGAIGGLIYHYWKVKPRVEANLARLAREASSQPLRDPDGCSILGVRVAADATGM